MHNSYLMWFCALRFVTCKVSVDGFGLLFSKLLLAKLNLIFLVPLLLNWFGILLAYLAALFMTSVCRLLSLSG